LAQGASFCQHIGAGIHLSSSVDFFISISTNKIIQNGGKQFAVFLPVHGDIAKKLCFTGQKRKYIEIKDDSKIKDKRTSTAICPRLYQLYSTFPTLLCSH
jgi:hypothetical protein